MKCYFHNDREATSFCKDCNKYLCPECYDQGSYGLCYDCSVSTLKTSNSNELSVHTNYLITSTIIFIIGFMASYLIGKSASYDSNDLLNLSILLGVLGMILHSGISLVGGFFKELSFIIIVFSVIFFLVIFIIIYLIGVFTFIPRYIYHLFMVLFILYKRRKINNF
jgi:uncharacterized paraquat-inducible protein A